MKKLNLLFVFAVLFGTILNAQNNIAPSKIEKVPGSANIYNAPAQFPSNSVEENEFKFKAIKSVWFNYNDALAGVTSQNYTSGTRMEYLFNDTGMYTQWSNGHFTNSNVSKIGTVLDPSSPAFEKNPIVKYEISKYKPYSLDSILFFFLYDRNLPDKNIVDTLIFEVFSSADLVQNGQIQLEYIADATNYTDTVFSYYLVNKLNGSVLGNLNNTSEIIKVPLDSNSYKDTLNAGYFTGFNKIFLTPQNYKNVKDGHNVGVTVAFKPGYSYNIGDTINKKNFVRFPTGEQIQSKQNSYPFYMGEKDKNCTYVYPSQIVTLLNQGTTDVRFLTMFFLETLVTTPGAFSNEWVPFSFDLSYEDNDVSTEEHTGVSKLSAYPNPSSQDVTIAYNITSASNVVVNIYNTLGKLIHTETSDNILSQGAYMNRIDISSFPAGTYYYSVNGVSSSFIVTK